MMSDSLKVATNQSHDTDVPVLFRSRLGEGRYRDPKKVYLRAVAAEPQVDLQIAELALYALELSGGMPRRADIEGDVRLLRSEVEDLADEAEDNQNGDAAEKAVRLQKELATAEAAASAVENLAGEVRALASLDAGHSPEHRDAIHQHIVNLQLEDAPCLTEISAIEQATIEGRTILDRSTTQAARRILEMLIIRDINIVAKQSEPEPNVVPQTEAA